MEFARKGVVNCKQKNARKNQKKIRNRVKFARKGLCKDCVFYSLLTDYFVSISSVGGSIWPIIPVYIV